MDFVLGVISEGRRLALCDPGRTCLQVCSGDSGKNASLATGAGKKEVLSTLPGGAPWWHGEG